MKLIITFSSIIFILIISACSEEFLEPEPLSFYAPENAFSNVSGYEAALVTLRKDLTKEQTSRKNLMAHQWMASEAGVPWVNGSNDWRLLTPTSEGNQRFVTQINTMFEIVKNANTIISRIDAINWPEEESRNQVLAEALWHRSYWYYRLVGCYGDLPFVKDEVRDAKLDYQTHSRWAILEKLQEDMEWAVQWMVETGVPGQPTRGAGNHLLTKIYLANMEWDKAIEAATRVIDGPYALITNRFGVDAGNPNRNLIWDLHRPDNKNLSENTETILAFVDRFEAPDDARTGGLYTMRVYNPPFYSPHNNRDSIGGIGFIDAGPMYDSLGRGNPDCPLSDWHSYDIWNEGGFTWETTPDLRRADINWVDRNEYFYNNPESVQYGDPFDPENMSIDPGDHWARIYPTPHYKIFAPQQNEASIPNGGNGDWYIYRLAETYLLRAEAYFWKEDATSAAEDINIIRSRANAPLISAADISIDFIFDERARELFAESPRQNELNRVSYIMAMQGLGGYDLENLHTRNWFYDRVKTYNDFYNRELKFRLFYIEPYNFQWPIDDNMINANTLGRINQNLGYTGSERNEPPLEIIE